ncbi:lysozyme-like protein [Cristinia sonorae]|uniref:Lysozyme-like protein n=1 Tax=Cristinia sonorae TaxID=1940300 RepID=A0A8K0UL89_9AGAR|nr:lysozyme-like protein [Cristinia sonorae]
MKLTTPFLLLAAAVGVAQASSGHHVGISRISTHHNAHARHEIRAAEPSAKKRGQRCKPKPATPAKNNAVATPPKHDEPPKNDAPKNNDPPKNNNPPKNEDKPKPPPQQGPSHGVIQVWSDQCGASGASPNPSAQSGPNGNLDWLNCGVDGGGWNPPHITPQDLITKPLRDAVNDPNSPFKACAPFLGQFESYANQNGIPAILVASIAMQESSCNPNAVGGGGEQGLMQITKEKCGGAPGGNCRDPDFNIRTGVKFFADTLRNNGNNVVKTLGQYNGWYPGLTVGKATAAANGPCCRCQNNLDYLHQTFNGWVLGISPTGFGKYHNLDRCN